MSTSERSKGQEGAENITVPQENRQADMLFQRTTKIKQITRIDARQNGMT